MQITKENIINEYVNKDVSLEEVSKLFNVSRDTLRRRMVKFDIPRKSKTRNSGRKTEFPQLSDKKWLENELRTKSMKTIAEELGTTIGNVGDRANRYSIRTSEDRSTAIINGIKKRFPNGRWKENSSNWKGGRSMRGSKQKYVGLFIPEHPYADTEGYVMEHRLVMEKKIGRHLLPEEVVHHKNGKKHDNRVSNLQLFQSKGDHVRHHFEMSRMAEELHASKKTLKKTIKQLIEIINSCNHCSSLAKNNGIMLQ